MKFEQITENSFKTDNFKVFLSEKLLDMADKKAFEQLSNLSKLPNCLTPIAMPDMHSGYGFPIGGVLASEMESGIVIPGGIGFDINCGIRALATNLTFDDIQNKISEILDKLLEKIGVGLNGNLSSDKHLSEKDICDILNNGLNWCLKNGFATNQDLENCESNGKLNGDSKKVSKKAIGRARQQLGTLGSGNHFIEIQKVDEIFDSDIAKEFGIIKKNQIVIMIHSGSRGLGHRVASDYIEKIKKNSDEKFIENLEFCKINSKIGQNYLLAMNAAANFGYVNRQMMTYEIRRVFSEFFENFTADLIYDVSHNIAKVEEFNGKNYLVHRKGATRCFGKKNPELPKKYFNIGQPVIIPGSMGTSSYILCGNNESHKKSLNSSAHGSGRILSRSEASVKIDGEKVKIEMNKNGILIKGPNFNEIATEAPEVYKNVNDVVEIVTSENLANKVVRLLPIGVLKG